MEERIKAEYRFDSDNINKYSVAAFASWYSYRFGECFHDHYTDDHVRNTIAFSLWLNGIGLIKDDIFNNLQNKITTEEIFKPGAMEILNEWTLYPAHATDAEQNYYDISYLIAATYIMKFDEQKNMFIKWANKILEETEYEVFDDFIDGIITDIKKLKIEQEPRTVIQK